MAAAEIKIDAREVLALGRRMTRAGYRIREGAMRLIGALLESQTRRRIHDEKAAPDGTSWEPWSEEYAATREGDQSLLMSEGFLHDLLTTKTTPREVVVGSNREYAAAHQFGYGAIPARPYLGISDDNAREIDATLVRFFDRAFA